MKLLELVVLKILMAILSGDVSRNSVKIMRIKIRLESHSLIIIMKIISNARNIKQSVHKQ